MSKNASALKVKLSSYDELFGANAPAASNQIVNVTLSELHTFKNHPFHVNDDKEMEELAESIREHGVLIPGIVRPRAEGGYELIAGHRRKHGSELAGKTEMPVIVREYTDDEATIMMVDSNIQRESILPSEKAKAYALKYEALKHQGKRSGKSTLDQVGEAAGENAKKVQRYLWLSKLSDQLLHMVDEKRLGLSQGVDLSFLSKKSQQIVADAIEQSKCTVSMGQSAKLKEYDKQDTLTPAVVMLYGLMLDRMALSMKNNWLDDKNRAYIIYSIDSVMEDLSCSKPTCVKIMKELDMIGLIERRRKGLGKPDIIYVKNFVLKEECEELENEAAEENENETEILEECFEYSEEKLSCQSDDMTATEEENVTAEGKKVELPEVKKFNFCNSKNLTSGSKDFLLPEVKNLAPNYNNNNYNNQSYYSIYPSNLSSQKDEFDGTKEEIDENTTYIEQIKKNLDYEFYMTNDKCNDKALLKELFDLICEVVCVKRKMIKVGGVVYPYEYVRSKFLELTSSHVWYVIDCMKETTTRIVNIKAYLLAALFNAPSTIDYYYQQKVQHDLHSDAVGEL